jgi:predicted metal-dependent phosphoesterase TrpH
MSNTLNAKLLFQVQADLHIHTRASDGTWSIEELISEVAKTDIKLFSVTDHDSLDSIPKAIELAKNYDLAFLPGVEISSTLNGSLFHILGYGIDTNNQDLNILLEENRVLMEKKDTDTIKLLIEKGFALSLEDYINYQNDTSRGGWPALNFLIDNNMCTGAIEFFNIIARENITVPFPVFSHPSRVIETIRLAGGIPILAHPGNDLVNKNSLSENLKNFNALKIDGFECYHISHTKEMTNFCLDWCKEYDLIITGGSDCHGKLIESRNLGFPYVTLADLNLGKIQRKII